MSAVPASKLPDAVSRDASTRAWRGLVDQARGWGLVFAAGGLALLLAAVVALAWVPAMRRDADTASDAADRADRRIRVLHSQARAVPPPPAPARFVAAFPAADTRQARLAALFALAAAHGLQPRSTELKLAPERALGLNAYTLAMPLTGSYAQVRDFAAAALAADPALSLDHLRLHRGNAAASQVEADLGWTLYLQPPADGEAAR